MLKDKWIRIVGYPIVITMMSVIFGWDHLQAGDPRFLFSALFSAVHTVFIWEGCRRIFFHMRKYYPGISNTAKRIVLQSTLSIVYTLIIKTSIHKFEHYAFPGVCESAHINSLSESLIIFIPLVIISLIYESVYFFEEWKKNIQQTEALARVNIQSQFEALKKQLDPHFLFNSLNTLASLIDAENEPAQEYLERLSDVYRYVLETRNKTTVTLESELEFLEAYIYLNKVRFRDNLQIEQELSDAYRHRHIPALSLQLLVENAIKHNVVSREHPLVIRIFEEEGQLVVENKKRVKQTLGHSTKIGLQNIINRYEILTSEPIVVINNEVLFSVKLPLLQPVLS